MPDVTARDALRAAAEDWIAEHGPHEGPSTSNEFLWAAEAAYWAALPPIPRVKPRR